MAGSFRFDPDRVAYAEAAGWRAYYERNWPRMLQLLTQVNREQFHMPLLASVLAAYYTVQAGRHWLPQRAEQARTQYYLIRFFRHARAHSGLTFDPVRAGELEMAYWDIARRIKQGAPRDEFVRTMTELHSTIFGITPDQAAESAELRVQANELVNEITAGTARDPERTWSDLEEKLRLCYRSIRRELDKETATSAAAS
ncbi:MAG: hypothetical protein JOZ41_02485 [Chloroflexi bacterium]|nr:hypothetical protein [Chloroflexota bacterium]